MFHIHNIETDLFICGRKHRKAMLFRFIGDRAATDGNILAPWLIAFPIPVDDIGNIIGSPVSGAVIF